MSLGKTLRELRATDEASKDRKDFMDTYDEISYYGYAKDYNEKLYKNLSTYFGSMENSQLAKINRAAEYLEIVGSSLYPNNPDASVNTDEGATIWQQKRNVVEEKLLDYIMTECDEQTHGRRATNEALMSGRGMVWFGWNERKGLPQAVFDTVKNFGWDSSAKNAEEVGYCWRKRSKTKWMLKSLYPDKTDLIESKCEGKKPNDLVEYYEFDFKVDPHNYCEYLDGGEDITWEGKPMTIIVIEDAILSAAPWPVRYDKIDGWRCLIMDLRQRPNCIWPSAPMEPGLCHLKNLNWIYTLFVERVMTTSKLVWALMETPDVQIGKEAVSSALSAMVPDGSMITFKSNLPDANIANIIQRFPLDTAIQAFDQAVALYERMWQESTGLNDLVRSGQDSRQLRTAADVDFKSKRSMTRIEDMKVQVVGFLTRMIQHLSLAARTLLTQEDIAKRFGKEAAAMYGMLEPQEGVAAMESQARDEQAQIFMMEEKNKIEQEMAMGLPPSSPPLTPEALEEKLGPPKYASLDSWIADATRSVVGGSMRPVDHDAQVDNINFMLSNLSPILNGMPGGQRMIAATIEASLKLNRYPLELQQEAKILKQAVEQAQAAMMAGPPMGAPPGQMPPNPVPGEPPPQGLEQAVMGQSQ